MSCNLRKHRAIEGIKDAKRNMKKIIIIIELMGGIKYTAMGRIVNKTVKTS